MNGSKNKNHGGRRPGAGRPVSGKVKLTVHILPETRAKLGDKPGKKIDAAFSEPNSSYSYDRSEDDQWPEL
jgi:hypothetical protein